MSQLFIRHAPIEWNVNSTDKGPPITDAGWIAARLLGQKLREQGYDTREIGVSPKIRSHLTAVAMGAELLIEDPVLDEVFLTLEEQDMLLAGEVPLTATTKGIEIASNLPPTQINISHGASLAGFSLIMGIKTVRHLPRNLEVRKI